MYIYSLYLERTSPDLTSRLVETNVQLQRLDQTFRTLVDTDQRSRDVDGARDGEGARDDSSQRGGSRGHSLSRTRVQRSEGPLDQMIEAMIKAPAAPNGVITPPPIHLRLRPNPTLLCLH